MNTRADSIRVVHPLFQTEGGGSTPTSALSLWFSVIDLDRAKELNRLWHSRFPEVGGGGSRVCYAATFEGLFFAVAIWKNPDSPKLPQLKWMQLKRWAIADDAPNGTASRMMKWMRIDIRRRFPGVEVLVSYSDPDTHDGAIYKACGWEDNGTTIRKGQGWANRQRERQTNNEPCERVTRWMKPLTKGKS